MNATFNAGIDYFGLGDASSNALKVKSSAENRSMQSNSGPNSYGDIVVVDSYGETAAPSAEYEVVAALTQETFPKLGAVNTVTGIEKPVVFGTVTISTQNGSAPTVSVSGTMVQTGATTLRDYTLPAFSLTPRHRAQDFLSAIVIKKGNTVASDVNDYGLESVSATFPIEITLSQPKGVVTTYDLHGGTATATYTMNWYAQKEESGAKVINPPTITLSDDAVAAGFTMSAPVSKSDPEGGYTQFTWTVSMPLVGEEHTEDAEQ